MIKYKALFRFAEIDRMYVVRETEMCVYEPSHIPDNPHRIYKSTNEHRIFDTWEQAHIFLLEKAEEELNAARRALQRAQNRYGNIKGMKKPTEIFA